MTTRQFYMIASYIFKHVSIRFCQIPSHRSKEMTVNVFCVSSFTCLFLIFFHSLGNYSAVIAADWLCGIGKTFVTYATGNLCALCCSMFYFPLLFFFQLQSVALLKFTLICHPHLQYICSSALEATLNLIQKHVYPPSKPSQKLVQQYGTFMNITVMQHCTCSKNHGCISKTTLYYCGTMSRVVW